MAEITKPLSLNIIWSSSGVATAPSTTKYQNGWVVEAPPYQTVNYIFNKTDKVIAHLNQFGFLGWDNETEYQADKSWTRYNGTIYYCVQTHTNQNPSTDVNEDYWVPILTGEKFLPLSEVSAYGLDLIDSTDASAARAALGGTTTGSALFTSASASAARTTLGATATGSSVFTAASQAAARTAIGIASSSESSEGLIEIASTSEMNAGSDDTRAATPYKLKLGFSISLGTNGHFHFPSWLGGLQIKWGTVTVAGDSSATGASGFTNDCLNGVCSLGMASAATDYNPPKCAPSGTNLIIYNSDSSSITARYIAVGY